MTKYAGEVVNLLSLLEVQQLSSFIKTLGIRDVKVLHAEVLPQIRDLERRKQIKQLLTEREKQLFVLGKEQVLEEALRQTVTITECLQGAFESLTKEALSALNNEETRKLVITKASKDELELLQEKIKSLNELQFAELQLAIEEEQKKRSHEPQDDMDSYKKRWEKKPNHFQWEGGNWEKLVKHTNDANQEIRSRPVPKPAESSKNAAPGFFSRIWDGFKSLVVGALVGLAVIAAWVIITPFKSFAQTVGFFWDKITPKRGKNQGLASWIAVNALTFFGSVVLGAATFVGPLIYNYLVKPIVDLYDKVKTPKPPEPYKLEINEEERTLIEKMRHDGANSISAETAITKVGDAGSRKDSQIETSMMTRFGMVVASQMVAGTKGAPGKHNNIGSVIGSLSDPDDTEEVSESIYEAVTNVLPESPDSTDKNPLKRKNGDHAFGIGGYPELVVAYESKLIKKIAENPEVFEEMGVKFTKEEREQLQAYKKNQDKSAELINIIRDVKGEWGGYQPVSGDMDEYEPIPDENLRKKNQDQFDKKLAAAGKAFQETCLNLKDGEALYLETGLEKHAMQLVVKREKGELKFSTYDSSGALENTTNKNSLLGLFRLSRMGFSAMRKNALTFKVKAEKVDSKEGLDYLTYLIRSGSPCGWSETQIKANVKHTSIEELNHMGTGIWAYIKKLFALNDKAFVYQNYIDNFRKLASPDAPPHFEELLQRPQNTMNCYAKKIQSNELYELGKPLYKKVRLATLIEQHDSLFEEITGGGKNKDGSLKGEKSFVANEYKQMLKNLEPEFLSPKELHDVSMRLTEINRPPSIEYYKEYFEGLLAVKEKLQKAPENEANKLAIARIDKKIVTRSEELYRFLTKDVKKGAPNPKQTVIDNIFTEEAKQDGFKWDGKTLPLQNDQGKIKPIAFEKLCEHATALAWKASLQLINHQIKKLSVRERHINSPEDRLEPIAAWRLGTPSLKDLEGARIVSFVEGFERKEGTKVEINVGGTYREISKTQFFNLVVANTDALTSPHVISVLDALRNTHPDVEQKFAEKVYPKQRDAFIKKLEEDLENANQAILATTQRLEKGEQKVTEEESACQNIIDDVKKEIRAEQALIGEGKQSIKLKNLESRKQLLEHEFKELNELKAMANNQLSNLRGNNFEDGSPASKKAKAEDILKRLKENPEDLWTINAVSYAFRNAKNELDQVQTALATKIKDFEIDEVEKQSNLRLYQMGVYRENVISNFFETNPQYRIFDDLAAGRMGTELTRNRDMYSQTPEKRSEVFRQGKTTFNHDSVWDKIQKLNQRLKSQIIGAVETRVLLSTETYAPSSVDEMASGNSVYEVIDEKAKLFCKDPVALSAKAEWMKGMFAIWLATESKDKLSKLQSQPNPDTAIKDAFHHFLEQKANIKYGVLTEAGFPLGISKEDLGWKPITSEELKQLEEAQIKASNFLKARWKAGFKPKDSVEPKQIAPQVELLVKDLIAKHDPEADVPEFNVPEGVEYQVLYADTVIDVSTLEFLKKKPTPVPPSVLSREKCAAYCNQLNDHLDELKGHNGLENKDERIVAFCNTTAASLFALPFPPSAKIVNDITDCMLARYKDKEGSLDEAFMKLENAQRAQILKNLIKLNLTQIPIAGSGKTKVDSKFYSTIKQWERLIVPTDALMSERINKLEPGGNIPADFSRLEKVDSAVQYSPIGIEGLHEGQKGMQIALTEFGSADGHAVDAELRKLADRIGMRNGGVLLAHQFREFYRDQAILIDEQGLNSTVGRELFTRAFTDALTNAKTDQEKGELIQFINDIRFEQLGADACTLTVKFDEFLEEIMLRASIIAPNVFNETLLDKNDKYVPTITETKIAEETAPEQRDGTKRLFRFAREVNIFSLQIESLSANKATLLKSAERISEPKEREKIAASISKLDKEIDELYAKLICSNLAFRLIYDQTPEEILIGISKNFEMSREMASVQANINKHQSSIVDFPSKLNEPEKAAVFKKQFEAYAEAKKFNDVMVKITGTPTPHIIPGFISLGGGNSLDTLHGGIYIGDNKLGFMPAHIQSHIALEMLQINRLPFKSEKKGYIYTENKKIKASITPQEDGSLLIHRELKTIDGQAVNLQYISPEQIDEKLPLSIRRRLGAEHFFIDRDGAIHAFTADFTPVLKVKQENEVWSGVLVKNGEKTSVVLNNDLDIVKALSIVFPPEEMIVVDENTVFFPAISKFIMKDGASENYFIADSTTDVSLRKHLEITKEGSALTTKVLLPVETTKVSELTQKNKVLNEKLETISGSGLKAKQEREKIERSIQDNMAAIRDIQNPESLLFVGNSPQIKKLEAEHDRLRQEMLDSFSTFRKGGNEVTTFSLKYDEAKTAYFQVKHELKEAYASADYLRVYQNKNGVLTAKDFQSILHLGEIEGKSPILTKMLGVNVPTVALRKSELEELHNLQEKFKAPQTTALRLARVTLLAVEIQHHLLERAGAATGKLDDWDREAYSIAVNSFKAAVGAVETAKESIPVAEFSQLWGAIQSEFVTDQKYSELFTKPVEQHLPQQTKQPLSLNTKTTDMPIEAIDGRTHVQFKVYDQTKSLIDTEQSDLAARLRTLEGFKESVQAQEDGFLYENYGLLNDKTLEKIFSITDDHVGAEGLSKTNIADLMDLMKRKRWIQEAQGMDGKFQVSKHPSEFFSSAEVGAFLSEQGFDRAAIKTVSERLETFLYQTAFSGGTYALAEGQKEGALTEKIAQAIEKYNMEYLDAKYGLEGLMEESTNDITFADLNAAYLLNDYREILAGFPSDSRENVQIALKNGMTRMLFNKTELDHFNDIQTTFGLKQESKAIAMLHIKRNYSLDKLLESESRLNRGSKPEDVSKEEQDQKMQRAFLLFESEFGHRCNTRQVNVFRGLLLDDEMNPEKIDSAQARMGFGKTTLLPLVALYKTGGDKLVRFIVPKSALETNTADMSTTLSNVVGKRAVKDDFQRYKLASDPNPDMLGSSPRLIGLQDARADLQKRLALYKQIKENREVLVQAPNVRNAMECQSQIFSDALIHTSEKPTETEVLQNSEMMRCITLLNKTRTMESLSIFDELDATQNASTTDVNYTSGNKIPINPKEIIPLEVITQKILAAEDKKPAHLADLLLEKFGIAVDDRAAIKAYILDLETSEPSSVTPANSTQIYLMRAILTDPEGMLKLFTDKEPGKDFGVWFKIDPVDGSKKYDRDALRTAGELQAKNPLLITVPYSAANQPKPQGSRFDNPEVTAITTLLFYMNKNTKLDAAPHLEYLVESLRSGIGIKPFLNATGEGVDPEFNDALAIIEKIAKIPETVSRNEQRDANFAELERMPAFRKMLARTIIQDQIKFDAGKANSNRYEQGNSKDAVIGFSGTAGDTSSHFKENMLDPAADGNMTLGIMARKENQTTHTLDTTDENDAAATIAQLAKTFGDNTRALIDVGGLCKVSNREVAKLLAMQLKKSTHPKLSKLEGVIFYDDVSNMKKFMVVDESGKETIKDLTPDLVTKSDRQGSFFTFYDQSHSRGADIKQMDEAEAALTVSLTLDNNDYKQAVMRLRKIIDRNLKQSFYIAIPDNVRVKILVDLELPKTHKVTGNDVAFWLRKNELKANLSGSIAILNTELNGIVKNAIMQQQAEITNLMDGKDWTLAEIAIFKTCLDDLNKIAPFITGGSGDLKDNYGVVYGKTSKEAFVKEVKERFAQRMNSVFTAVNTARAGLGLATVDREDKKPYFAMEKRIIERRGAQLPQNFTIPNPQGNALSEAHSETENQSHSQSESQSQTQTHSFSQVNNEEVVVDARIKRPLIEFEPANVNFLKTAEDIALLSLASQTKNMSNIFTKEDPIATSPAFKGEGKYLIPPLRYFVAREDGTPRVILLNQDEANAFKATCAPDSKWTLYDIRSRSEEGLAPVAGPKVASLKDPLLKKLNFAAHRFEVKSQSVESIATSLEGVFTKQQLEPTLEIQFSNIKNFSKENPVFDFTKWGFDGIDSQEIQVKIKQTKEEIDGQDGKPHDKTGATISVQLPPQPVVSQQESVQESEYQAKKKPEHANVFISSILKDRITAQGNPKLTEVARQVRAQHTDAMAERVQIRKEIADVKLAKAKTLTEYLGGFEEGPNGEKVPVKGKIPELEEQITQLVAAKKVELGKEHLTSLGIFLNYREKAKDNLGAKVSEIWNLRIGGLSTPWGTKAFGKYHTQLNDVYEHCIRDITAQNKLNKMKPEEIAKKVDEYVEDIFTAVNPRYQERIDCGEGSVLTALLKAAQEPEHIIITNTTNIKKKSNFKTTVTETQVPNTNVKIGKKTLEKYLYYELMDHKVMDDCEFDDETTRRVLWPPFIKAMEEEIVAGRKDPNLTEEVFLQRLIARIQKFAEDANIRQQNPDRKLDVDLFVTSMMPRIYMSLNTESKEKNLAVIKEDMRKVFYEGLVGATLNPGEDDKGFYDELNKIIVGKVSKSDFVLPPELTDFEKAPVALADMRAALVKLLAAQHVQMPKIEIDALAKSMVECVNGRKGYEAIIDNFKAVEDRSGAVYTFDAKGEQVDGWVFNDVYDVMAELDDEVLPLQKKLAEERGNLKAAMKKSEVTHIEIRVRAEKNDERVQESRKEMSALNKLIEGLKNLLGIFSDNHVKVEQAKSSDHIKDEKAKKLFEDTQAMEFIDEHFKVAQIVSDNVTADVSMIFTPPKYYDVQKDMSAQEVGLHGLCNRIEEGVGLSEDFCGSAFTESVGQVKLAAQKVQPRTCETDGLREQLEVQQEMEHEKELEIAREKQAVLKKELYTQVATEAEPKTTVVIEDDRSLKTKNLRNRLRDIAEIPSNLEIKKKL